jgi:predicted phage tail protein
MGADLVRIRGPVEGRKGGGKGGRTPVEQTDNLRSVQYAQVLDLICEGEVEGLVNGLQSVYLDKVPVQNADLSYNFEGVTFASTKGTQGQAALPGFDTVQNEIAVGVQVLQATPIVRTITDTQVNRVRVTIGFPTMSYQNPENGDISGTSVEFAIDLQSNGGGYNQVYSATVSGKTTTRYLRAVVIDLTGSAPWDIRVRRVSPPAATSNIQNQTWWDSYTEIQAVKLRYPNSVVHGLRVSAQQFSRIPERAYDMALMRTLVPVNYNPITRAYTGVWNGTFKIAWHNNPAWAMYDMCTNERYGLGAYLDPLGLDKWQLYEIGQYCDELVPDGRGGMQPRFTCNVLFQTREEAYKVLQDLAALFRGAAFWHAGGISFTQDAPSDAAMLFTPDNVSPEGFVYASTSSSVTRHSVAIVYWNNPAEFFKRVPEVVVNDEMVAKIGIREIELNPIGVTSRGQANRIGRWALFSEDREAQTIAFKAGMEAEGVTVGQVFKVHDPHEVGERMGGRIKAATASAVTLDAPVTLVLGETYTLSCSFEDASELLGYRVEERSVTNSAGLHSTLNVSPAFSSAPQAQTIWMLASNAVLPTLWRLLTKREIKPGQYEITGVEHDPGKYALIEQGMVLETRPVSRLSERPQMPSNLQLSEVLYLDRSLYKSRLAVAWSPAALAAGQRYRVSYRFNEGSWVNLPDVSEQSIDINGLDPGVVDVRVRSINTVLGVESRALEASYTLLGKTAPPQQMQGLSLALASNGVLATWNDPSDVDPDWTGAELSTSPAFATAAQITRKKSTTHLLGWLPAGTNTVYGRVWDEERSSLTAASASINILAPAPVTLVRADVEANFLTAQWNDSKTSQPILRYSYKLGTTAQSYEDAAPYGSAGADSRSDVIRGQSAGTYRVWFVATDVAGNSSTPVFVDVTFTLPTDFTLADRFDATFAGSGTNVTINAGRVYLLMLDEQDGTHFSSRSWTNDSDAIAAGSARYFQPGTTTATYHEEYDLGADVDTTTIKITQTVSWLVGTGTIETDISYKLLAGDPWTVVSNVASLIASNLRYIRVTVRAIASGNDDLAQLTSMFTECSLRRVYEPFTLTLNAADTLGTPYVTSVGFSDIQGAVFGIPQPNPNGIARVEYNIDDSGPVKRVLWFGFNSAGTRVSGDISGQINGV